MNVPCSVQLLYFWWSSEVAWGLKRSNGHKLVIWYLMKGYLDEFHRTHEVGPHWVQESSIPLALCGCPPYSVPNRMKKLDMYFLTARKNSTVLLVVILYYHRTQAVWTVIPRPLSKFPWWYGIMLWYEGISKDRNDAFISQQWNVVNDSFIRYFSGPVCW